jgi:hypothetical protein
MERIKPLETSEHEFIMWQNTIEKVNELVNAVNEMIPFTTGLEDDKESKKTIPIEGENNMKEEKDVYWKGNNYKYYAYPKRDYEKPIISEKDGCWEITINKITSSPRA